MLLQIIPIHDDGIKNLIIDVYYLLYIPYFPGEMMSRCVE